MLLVTLIWFSTPPLNFPCKIELSFWRYQLQIVLSVLSPDVIFLFNLWTTGVIQRMARCSSLAIRHDSQILLLSFVEKIIIIAKKLKRTQWGFKANGNKTILISVTVEDGITKFCIAPVPCVELVRPHWGTKFIGKSVEIENDCKPHWHVLVGSWRWLGKWTTLGNKTSLGNGTS